MLENRYGHFARDGASFVVTDPAPPMPWCNVICNGRMGLVISHNGGGFSFFDDAQHNVLTRWDMDLARDHLGKFLLLADRDSGEVWSAAPAPCRPAYEQYRCEHGPGYTRFSTRYKGIGTEWTVTVAPADAAELWLVEITNHTDKPRRLRAASYFEWTCGVAPDVKREFHRLFFKTDYDASRRAAFATKVMWDIRPKTERQHWNQAWPYHAAFAIGGDAFEKPLAVGDKSFFLGRYGTPVKPEAMSGPALAGMPKVGQFGRFGDAVCALGGDVTLAPGQTMRVHFVLAIAADRTAVTALVDKYRERSAAVATAAAAADAWTHRLSATRVKTARADFDLLNNTWLPYQAISGRLWGRTGYYQQSGAFGFRDQLQDSQVWLPLEPGKCGEQIMLHAHRQYADGSVDHWWHALADFGNHTACSDDYLWLPFITANYLKETGDYGILEKTAPFMDEPANRASVLEHCRRSIARAFKRTSPRGLPHIGSCDWNDGLSAMGIDEKGESVWLAMFLCRILADWAVILDRVGTKSGAKDGVLSKLAAEYRAKRDAYADAVNLLAWDGAWYRYGTKDSGEWVGASSSPEGQVHLNAQTWAILADVAPADRAAKAWTTVKDRLLSPFGPLLLDPAYTEPDPDIGYVTRYCPGSRENGGVYMHAATWALAAAAKRKDVEAVGRIWRSISPPTRGQDADSYWAEPYVTPGNVDGPLSDKPGRAGWTWYTGSAAWLNRVSLEWVLGIRPEFAEQTVGGDGAVGGEVLVIDPCPPADLGQVEVTRTWRGVGICVRFDAAKWKAGVAPTVRAGGRVVEGGRLSAALVAELVAAAPAGGAGAGVGGGVGGGGTGAGGRNGLNGKNGAAAGAEHKGALPRIDVTVEWSVAGQSGAAGGRAGSAVLAGTRESK